jgi:flagellar capping protein FliD
MALIHIDKVVIQADRLVEYETQLNLIIKNQKTIMARQEEIAQQLRDMKAQNEKARQENLAKFTALEEAVANAGNSTPEVDEALADLKASIQADDDENPDAVSGEETPIEEGSV